ncbi:outer membrane protein [Mesorhizobium humile]|uniref:Porin family protein n=1 Tax=Mesorhizobium humile TaxID=3072313 RepID=A0ABU4YET6_9HYPH|nr:MULTISPECIES: outer membrane protein [unclassified Mesorhizobium]MDX8460451.1 porin family protein [Mesorhizobium sp. VK2D]MDX8485460.1 porin family protein [Mesorhizobium sp. VK2B]
MPRRVPGQFQCGSAQDAAGGRCNTRGLGKQPDSRRAFRGGERNIWGSNLTMKTILLATAIILAPVGMACAADVNEGSPVAAYDWSGLYAGVHFGYAAGKSNLFIAGAGVGGTDVSDPVDPNGFIGGIHVGVNQELANRFVLGAEADLAYNNVDGLTTFANGGNTLLKSELKWSGSARLRAGYAFDRTLPYITAGVAAAKYELTAITGTPSGDITLHNEAYIGWTVGAGVEHAFTDKWIARVEYRYSDFGSKALSAAAGLATVTNVDLKTHDLRVGLSYKF